eukprot:Gb_13140 [translate_table: standard]
MKKYFFYCYPNSSLSFLGHYPSAHLKPSFQESSHPNLSLSIRFPIALNKYLGHYLLLWYHCHLNHNLDPHLDQQSLPEFPVIFEHARQGCLAAVTSLHIL